VGELYCETDGPSGLTVPHYFGIVVTHKTSLTNDENFLNFA
jgi:hypothetical protein